MHIVVFEPDSSGHRYVHVRRLLPTLAALGHPVTLVTSQEGIASREYRSQIARIEHLCTIESNMRIDRGAPVGATRRLFASNLHRVATDLGADHILVPYADGTIQIAGLRRLSGRFRLPGGVEIEGLMMRGSFAYAPSSRLRESLRTTMWLALTAAAPFAIVHHLDPIVIREIRLRAPRLASRVRLMPDPVDIAPVVSRSTARHKLGIPEDGRYIGCVGVIDRRKGIDLLIQAFLSAHVAPTDRLLLAGEHDKTIRMLLAGPAADHVRRGEIISMDGYLTDDELETCIAAMDVVATPYPQGRGHSGSSSIAIAAAGQQRPILGDNSGWIGDTIPRFGLGNVCNVMDRDEFARAIQISLDSSVDHRQTEGGRRFVAFHCTENFAASFTKRLRERLSLSVESGIHTWDWVIEASYA